MTSLALTHSGSSPSRRTPRTRGIFTWKGSPAMASATSRPPAPMASIPRAPPAQEWLSEPRSVFPGAAEVDMCSGWLTPLPGRLNQTPKRLQALSRKRWSSGFLKSSWTRL